MKILLLLFTFVSLFKIASAQSLKKAYQAQSELNRRGEVYFSFQTDDISQIKSLSRNMSISKIDGKTIYAFANQKGFSDFSRTKLVYTVLTAPSEMYSVKMSDNQEESLAWDSYPTYNAYEAMMQQFASDHPAICKLITIASLSSGRKILGLRISDNVDTEENEPEFLYSSTIHGNETTGYILMLHLADYLLSGYNSDERITNLVNNFDIVICPLANPDGTYKGGNSTVNGATRYNANNVDLNRNYPDPENGLHPDSEVWQPETIAFMNFAAENSFTMSANFHGGTEVVNYPWDTWSRLSADDAWWVNVSREYADTVHLYAPSNYMNLFDNGITNGFEWYEVDGGRQDFMNYFHFCRESTIEISDAFILPESQLISYWNYNYRSLINYIEQAGYGLHGLVTDSTNGDPLYAKVYISGFDKDSSHVYTDAQVGDYHRLLKGGNYKVTYSASGYNPKTIDVQVNDRQTTIRDVKLYKGTLSANSETTAHTDIRIYPNPVNTGSTIIESEFPVQILNVKDISGRNILTSSPSAKKLTVDCNWPSGIYLFQMQVEGKWINKKIQVVKD